MNRTMKQAAGLAAGLVTQRAQRYARPRGAIDQNAPLPQQTNALVPHPYCPPGYDLYYVFHDAMGHKQVWGPLQPKDIVPVGGHYECAPKSAASPQQPTQYTAADTARRARMEQVLSPDQQKAPPGHPPPYQPRPLGLHGAEEDNMQSDLMSMAAGLGTLFTGLAIPGPYGANPTQMMPSDTYEISGTGVAFRDAPSLGGAIIDTFNPDTSGGNSVVGTPDQVEFKGETGTGSGLTWAKVNAKGKTGFVAVEYMAPVGWTAKQGKVVPRGGGGGTIEPASVQTDSTTTTDYTPYILGGAAVLGGGIILWAVLAKPKGGGKRRATHRRRAHA